MLKLTVTALTIAATLAATPAFAQDHMAAQHMVMQPMNMLDKPIEKGITTAAAWWRYLMPARPAAGYLTLNNLTDKAKELTGATSDACGSIMLHHSTRKGGTDSMEMVQKITISPKGSVSLAPGGYHLMCTQPKATSFKPGQKIEVVLHFADGGEFATGFDVKGATGQ